MKTWLTLFVLAGLFSGCNSGVNRTLEDETLSTNKVVASGATQMQEKQSYTIIKSDEYPVNIEGEKETWVYFSDSQSDVESFNEAYLTLTNEIAPDFEGTMILAKMGEKSSGGYSIEVESVKDLGRFVEVTLVSKAPTGLATMALTNPYIFISLPNNHKEIKIIDK